MDDSLLDKYLPIAYRGGRRPWFLKGSLIAVLVSFGVASLYAFAFSGRRECYPTIPREDLSFQETPVVDTVAEVTVPEQTIKHDQWGPEAMLRGAPTPKFRDNLKDDVKYITCGTVGGWTNDVMTLTNLIYLGLLTKRTVVLPPFSPAHVGASAGTIPFSQVFDISRLRAFIRHPIIEWRDVKAVNSSDNPEPIGCWSAWMTSTLERQHRPNPMPHLFNLDITYSMTPFDTRLREEKGDFHLTFWSLAHMSAYRSEALQAIRDDLHDPAPDDHLMCFDFLYWVSAGRPFEYEKEWSPAWNFVGKHLHWNPKLEELALSYLRRAFYLNDDESIPPYISVHVRHKDFAQYCGDDYEHCFAPLSRYANAISEIQAELAKKHIIVRSSRVVVTSDETSEEWWDEVAAMGYTRIDYDWWRTVETLGKWYPVFIDAAVLSFAKGFVGTEGSTMSLLAARRVADWSDGPSRMVKWGALAKAAGLE